MKYDLAAMTKRARPTRKRRIVLRDIAPTGVQAADLYRRAYAPIVALWQRRGERIAAEYARTLSAMTQDSPADLQAEIDAAQTEFERLFIIIRASLEEWVVAQEAWVRGRWRGAVLSATNVDIGTLLGPADHRETLESYLAWNLDLVRDVNAQIRQRMSSAVFAGTQNRTPARDVAKQISEATGMARDRSLRIASDQLSRVTSALAAERRREAGITIYRYRHSGKKHPREDHLARNGKLYADDPSEAGRVIDGEKVHEPIPQGSRAGQPPFCGCREQAFVDLT